VAVDVIMPMLGMAQDSGRIVRWLKAAGDEVARGDPVLEVETDKATVQIEADGSGVLIAVTAAAGDDVPVGTVIARIVAADEVASYATAAPPAGAPIAATASAPMAVATTTAVADPAPAVGAKLLASPKARRIAAERGIDLATLTGTGPGRAVQAADVERAVAEAAAGAANGVGAPAPPPASPVVAPAAPDERSAAIWKRMVDRLAQGWQETPQFSLERAVATAALEGWLERARARGVEATITDLLVIVAGRTLARHPDLRTQWLNGTRVVSDAVDVGIAVAAPSGLVVPVLRGVGTATLEDVAQRRAAVVGRAREGRLHPDDLSGGTFTISNLGMFGVDRFRAIVNPPQAGILAVGRIRPELALDASGTVVERRICSLVLACDHRAVDGAGAARFLSDLAAVIEDPLLLVA
jgi:pyruvate dehydrogenase E2 component (dihydrolipoamide acetyltransferase)